MLNSVGLFAISYFVYLRVLYPWCLKRFNKWLDRIAAPKEIHLKMDERGVAVDDEDSSVQIFWSAISRIVQFRHGVGLMGSHRYVYVPNTAFSSDAERAGLIAFAANHLPRQSGG